MAAKTLDEQLVWLKASIENVARAYAYTPQQVCDMVIDLVCAEAA